MKLPFLLLIMLPLTIIAQKTYAPLNATWNYEGYSLNCEGLHRQFIVEQEVDVLGKECSIIFSYTAQGSSTDFIATGDSLIVWENDNKVYFLQDSASYLLYDFDLELGDTLELYDPVNRGLFSATTNTNTDLSPNSISYLVSSLDSIEISGELRQQFYLNKIDVPSPFCVDKGSIIAGIGSTGASINGDQCWPFTSGCIGGLHCYYNDEVEYSSSYDFATPNPDCEGVGPSAINDLSEFKNLNIFPNPASDVVYITGLEGDYSISAYDLNLRLIQKWQNPTSIPLRMFNDGIYILVLESKGQIKYHRLLKGGY